MPAQPWLFDGKSREITLALQRARAWAPGPDTILILGQPGTGKSLLAEFIHEESGRPGRFVKESASNIPDGLVASTLAGHRKGAFTGATESQVGLIESAHNGTFFLDELGDASPGLQQFLRRVLDDTSVQRVGDTRPIPTNVRFVFASNLDLRAEVAAGRFRRDLLDRIGLFWITMPKLAERRDEILGLMDFFFERERSRRKYEGRVRLEDDVREFLRSAPWNGNVRQLELACDYLVVQYFKLNRGERPIAFCDLPESLLADAGRLVHRRAEQQLTARRVHEALELEGGNKSEAAIRLGIDRRKLYRVLAASVTPGVQPHGPGCAVAHPESLSV